jgi:putative ABC transport system permease protein
MLRGRAFAERDAAGAPGVVIINEAFARRYWPGQEPLGKRLQMGSRNQADAPDLEVVGVVKDGKYVTLGEDARPFFYSPLFQDYDASATLIVRAAGNPLALLPALRAEVQTLDKNLPVYDVKTMTQHLALALLPARLAGAVLGVFGLVALGLAALGLYGVMSYTVTQRMREIGIRVALGAQAGDVLKLVIKQGLSLTLIGVGIGLAVSLALTRLVASLLFGLSATDPLTFALIVLLLTCVALLACYLPARRATKVDPMVALRYE